MFKRNCFTLVEILIVIAIITILAGLLLPALNKARNKARSISCFNNQKQITMAEAMYRNDYNGWVMGWQDRDSTNGRVPSWTTWVQALFPYAKSATFWVCPASPDQSTIANVKNVKTIAGLSSALNYIQTIGINSVKFGTKQVKVSSIKYPATLLYSGDCAGYSSSFTPQNTNQWRPMIIDKLYPANVSGYYPMHGKMINFSYIDGHVDARSYVEMLTSISTLQGRNRFGHGI